MFVKLVHESHIITQKIKMLSLQIHIANNVNQPRARQTSGGDFSRTNIRFLRFLFHRIRKQRTLLQPRGEWASERGPRQALGGLSLLYLLCPLRDSLRHSQGPRSPIRLSQRDLPFERSHQVSRLQATTEARRRRRGPPTTLSLLLGIFYCSG